jgi:hypothetical protein
MAVVVRRSKSGEVTAKAGTTPDDAAVGTDPVYWGGTKPLHDLITNLQSSAQAKDAPQTTSG